MCFGGGGGGTITMPDTSQYDRMADQQIALMKSQQEGSLKVKQNELNTALAGQQSALTELRDFKTAQAADVQANARRLSALMGPPPPDKSASAPVLGRDRKGATKAKGKKGLRVDRARTSSQGKGTGLSITI
jgi:hypothetical protein